MHVLYLALPIAMATCLHAYFPGVAAAQAASSGAHSMALGGATTAVPDDVRGELNPAAWAHVKTWQTAFHGAQLYGLSELRMAGAQLLVPLESGTAAVGVTTFGFDLYRATALDAGFGSRFGIGSHRKVSIGVRWRLHLVRVARYGRARAFGVTAGLLFPVTPFITLGIGARNVLIPHGSFRKELPRSLAVGFAFRPAPAFSVSLDTRKGVRSPLHLAAGAEGSLVPALALRVGVSSSPRRAAIGIRLRLPHTAVDLAAVRHDVLGWTPSMSLILRWN